MLDGSSGTVTNLPPCFVVKRGRLHFAQRASGESGVGEGTFTPFGSVFDFGVGVVLESASEVRERRVPLPVVPPVIWDLTGVTPCLVLLYT